MIGLDLLFFFSKRYSTLTHYRSDLVVAEWQISTHYRLFNARNLIKSLQLYVQFIT